MHAMCRLHVLLIPFSVPRQRRLRTQAVVPGPAISVAANTNAYVAVPERKCSNSMFYRLDIYMFKVPKLMLRAHSFPQVW